MKVKILIWILAMLLFNPMDSYLAAQVVTEKNYKLEENVTWGEPEETPLSLDIYTPDQAGDQLLPVLIIYHGGGWLINDKSIMNDMASYIANTGKYVVCNVDYRLLTANDNTVTLNEIVEDAMGALLWVKENIVKYSGDPEKIAVTGDSAGGQLASLVVNGSYHLGLERFNNNSTEYYPSYLPAGKNIENLQARDLKVQAVLLSYPAVDLYAAALNGFESPENPFWAMGNGEARGMFGPGIDAMSHPHFYKMVSPIYTVPDSYTHKLPPHFVQVGTQDNVTPPFMVQRYVDSLEINGQDVIYWMHKDRGHAYLDSGSNEVLNVNFRDDAIPAIERMLDFMDSVFYN
ncbi:alpha/beta hydrolase [Robertkochia aurantiaca]|uniref:alpha/beta hydrolase n=1 Tax=Robertkochia aurantiaca TaxID=2873700 RepID=UPI001CCB889F|nr:alpha/beta hydrolase [Robertkochia sp. 3YJGBD-33]